MKKVKKMEKVKGEKVNNLPAMVKKKALKVSKEKTDISTANGLIQFALSSGANMEQLQKLIDMRHQEEDRFSEKAFCQALSNFQSEVGPITKDKTVAFNTKSGDTMNYSYASLAQIDADIKDSMCRNGLSKRYEIVEEEKDGRYWIVVSCHLIHRDGHEKITTMRANPDNSGYKNGIQQSGSTITYLQRYTLICALGLTTANADNDGSTHPESATKKQKNQSLVNTVNENHDISGNESEKPVSKKREAMFKGVYNVWNMLKRIDPEKYGDAYFKAMVGKVGCADVADCDDKQLIELMRAIDTDRRATNGK